jgi:protein ImuB
MSLAEARRCCPEIVWSEASPQAQGAAQAAAREAAWAVSPHVEEAAPGLLFVDADGLSSLWGDGRGVAQALVAQAARLGLWGKAAVASSQALAQLAAERGPGALEVPEGQERAWLAAVPLRALPASAGLHETLAGWGLATAGALARLPRDGVGTRLGEAGVRLHRLASGELPASPLQPLQLPEAFVEVAWRDGADPPLVQVDALLFVLRPALERLLARLALRGLAMGSAALLLELDPLGDERVPIGLAGPTRDLEPLLGLLRQTLESRPPSGPVRGLAVEATPGVVKAEQLGLFDVPTPPPSRLLAVVSRLQGLLGEARVGQLELFDSHRPEARGLKRFVPAPAASLLARARPAPAPALALRRFPEPWPARLQGAPHGPARLVVSGELDMRAVRWAGPFRLEVEWAAQAPVRRDLYDVELQDGRVYRVAHGLDAGAWTVEGRYE